MSTASPTDIRAGLAANLSSIVGGQVSAYLLSNPTFPCAVVMRGPVSYDHAMGGGVHHWTFLVRVFVANVSDIGAAMKLDPYLEPEGAQSVKAAVESDPTLGGVVSDLHVTEASGEQVFVRDQGVHQQGGQPLLGSEWTVEVWL